MVLMGLADWWRCVEWAVADELADILLLRPLLLAVVCSAGLR